MNPFISFEYAKLSNLFSIISVMVDCVTPILSNAFSDASVGTFKGLIEVDNDKRVSSDFVGSTYSSTYVPDMTSVVNGNTVKVLAWYDNEWGYSSRLVDMTVLIGNR